MQILLMFVSLIHIGVYGQNTYKAAVLEYTPNLTAETPKNRVLENVKEFVTYIEEAAKKQVDIILFPEYGLTGININPNRLEEISTAVPNPTSSTSPCKNPQNYSKALIDLSCAAETHSMYVVVNLFERVVPNVSENIVYHNTNVVFNREGVVISRFRKMNLYNESYVETGNEKATFKTDFGVTFGVIICRDILFRNASIDLLLDEDVTDVLYSAAWSSELPFLHHLTVQHGYAVANGVNLLASGYNNPPNGLGGSGIYLANGSVAEISESKSSTMLIADVSKIHTRKPLKKCRNIVSLPSAKIDSATSDFGKIKTFQENLSNYTFVTLNLNQSQIYQSACSGRESCCHINLTVSKTKAKTNYVYKVLVFNGGRYILTESVGVRVCALVACLNDSISSCGLRSNSPPSGIRFESITLKATFKNDKSAQDRPATLNYGLEPITNYTYCKKETGKTHVEVTMSTSNQTNLLTFGIHGRVFQNDNKGGGVLNCGSFTLNRFFSVFILNLMVSLLYV